MSPPDKPSDKDDALLDDLESIKDLLDPEEGLAGDEQDIPVLDDFVEDQHSNDDHGLDEATIEKLLDDAWQDSVDDLFSDTRRTIEANATDWLPEDTDELAAALKVRIDASVKHWLAQTLSANIGKLHKHVVQELSHEIVEHLAHKLGTDDKPANERDPN